MTTALNHARSATKIAQVAWNALPQGSWFGFLGPSPPDHRVASVAIEFSKSCSCFANILIRMGNKEGACEAVNSHLKAVENSQLLNNALDKLAGGSSKVCKPHPNLGTLGLASASDGLSSVG